MKPEVPHYDLQRILRHLPVVLEATAQQPADVTILTKAFGYAPATAAAPMLVRSMVLFDLLHIESGSGNGGRGRYQYRATALAQAIVKEETKEDQWQRLVLRALTTPQIFLDLYSRFGANPPEDLVSTLQDEHDVPPGKATRVAKNYLRGLDLVRARPRMAPISLRPAKQPAHNEARLYTGGLKVTFDGGTSVTFPEGSKITRDLADLLFDVYIPCGQDDHKGHPGTTCPTTAVVGSVGEWSDGSR